MEAGLEHLSWAGGTLRHIDLLLVVVQPSPKVQLTARRIVALARQLGIPRTAFVGNRLRDGDLEQLRTFAGECGVELLATIPEDVAVQAADRVGDCLLDSAPDSDLVRAVDGLAARLEADFLSVLS